MLRLVFRSGDFARTLLFKFDAFPISPVLFGVKLSLTIGFLISFNYKLINKFAVFRKLSYFLDCKMGL